MVYRSHTSKGIVSPPGVTGNMHPLRLVARLALIAVLLVVLFGLLVSAGTILPDPAIHNYPHTDHVYGNTEMYIGEQVELRGPAVETEPLVIRIGRTGGHITITGADQEVEPGQLVSAFGVLTDGSTLEAERVMVREPWEATYMYVVSILAAMWVAGRIVRHWRFDFGTFAFVPRSDADG